MFYIIRDLAEEHESRIQSIICTHALTMIDRAPAGIINNIVQVKGISKIEYLKGDEEQDIRDFLSDVSPGAPSFFRHPINL